MKTAIKVDELPALLTTGQAAELTGLDPRYIRLLRETGTLTGYQLRGGSWRIVTSSLLRHMRLEGK